MLQRILEVLLALSVVTTTLGCAGTRNADPRAFYAAERLKLDDCGCGADKSVKRSVTISDPRTVAEVSGLLLSVSAGWKPVPSTPPASQFTLFAIRDDKLTDWLWVDAPSGDNGRAYMQMKLPGAGMYFTYISEKDFDTLLKMFGVPEWRKGPALKGDPTGNVQRKEPM
jgi:hypothetical protein